MKGKGLSKREEIRRQELDAEDEKKRLDDLFFLTDDEEPSSKDRHQVHLHKEALFSTQPPQKRDVLLGKSIKDLVISLHLHLL